MRCQCCREAFNTAELIQCGSCLAVLCRECWQIHSRAYEGKHRCATCPMRPESGEEEVEK